MSKLLTGIQGVKQFGNLYTFGPEEFGHLEALGKLVASYVDLRTPPRPLCLAVFGPPGSGKSYAVKQVKEYAAKQVKEVVATSAAIHLPMTTLNLTQMVDTSYLARSLARVAGEQDDYTVPIVFFDEFDAPRGPAPYGGLSWFLAPMHDGEFLHDSAPIRLKRAVYIFAGGTATKFEEFSNAQREKDEDFRFAKGPDFVSRLRGFVNVEGLNADKSRLLRRAIILRNALHNRMRMLKQAGEIIPCREVLEAMLRVGRYRHGARSIEAVIEASSIGTTANAPGFETLPEDHILRIHTDRGPLDMESLKGPVVLSAYFRLHNEHHDEPMASGWLDIAKSLWEAGATLAYGGKWEERWGQSLAASLAKQLKSLPKPLSKGQVEPKRLHCFGPKKDEPEPAPTGVQFLISNRLSDAQEKLFKVPAYMKRVWIIRVIRRFCRRLQLTEASAAMFAIGGVLSGYRGRFPNVAEEIMLALALNKPVYIVGSSFRKEVSDVGSHNTVANDVGLLLGLTRPWTGKLTESFLLNGELESERNKWLTEITDVLRPPP